MYRACWESYHEIQHLQGQVVRSAKVNSWKGFGESINEVPEPTRLRKIFAKDIKDVEESLRPSTGLSWTPGGFPSVFTADGKECQN